MKGIVKIRTNTRTVQYYRINGVTVRYEYGTVTIQTTNRHVIDATATSTERTSTRTGTRTISNNPAYEYE